MQIEPSAEEFAERYARGEAQVVWTTLVADLETPVSAFIKIAGGTVTTADGQPLTYGRLDFRAPPFVAWGVAPA